MSVSSINATTPVTHQPATQAVGNNSASSPVVASNDPGLAQEVGALSTNAAVVATLGSSASSGGLTYNAAGLYNSIAQAGPTASTASTATPATGTTAVTTPVATATPTTTTNSNSGFYTGNGVLQSDTASGTNLTANWANALKENPNLSNTVSADSIAQGIIGTISTTV